MFFLTQFTKLDGDVLTGRCYGVCDDVKDVNFNTLSSLYSTSVDFKSGSFYTGSYRVSLKNIDRAFVVQAIASQAYLCLDCDYAEDIF